MTTPLAFASLSLNVEATPIVEVMPVESCLVITPGGPSVSFSDGMPRRGDAGQVPGLVLLVRRCCLALALDQRELLVEGHLREQRVDRVVTGDRRYRGGRRLRGDERAGHQGNGGARGNERQASRAPAHRGQDSYLGHSQSFSSIRVSFEQSKKQAVAFWHAWPQIAVAIPYICI